MKRINSIEKISSDLLTNMQDVAIKAVQGEIESTVKFLVGTVVNLDSLSNRAKIRYMKTETDGTSGYTDIDAAIKTDEIININDVVIVFYIRNLANCFVFAKMTSSYYSKFLRNNYITVSDIQTITGQKTFTGALKITGDTQFTGDVIVPDITIS